MSLPIDAIIPAIREQLRLEDQLIIEAPPGAGKTTVVPLKLLNEPWQLGKILVLEPRRMAARTVAHRMAQSLTEKPGQRVGYRIRQEQKISGDTQIEVVTGGVLLNLLQADPALEDYSCIIFDEFHERNLDADLALSLCLHAREVFRESDSPLKIVLMSATLDGERLARFLKAPRLSSEGRSFPVDIHHRGEASQKNLVEAITNTIIAAHQKHKGNILVFLPGQREIEKLYSELSLKFDRTTQILPLYGSLPLAQQLKAIAPIDPSSDTERKVVLATDVAETSVTIEGITIVVDSCMQRRPLFDPKTGLARLQTQRISRASATQRSGRAGRLSPGQCYRLIDTTTTLRSYSPPEIINADLTPLCLQMLCYGVSSADELEWLDSPPDTAIASAMNLLGRLDAIEIQDNQARLTKHGAQLGQLNTHPRLAHMLIIGQNLGLQEEACLLAACFMESTLPRDWSADIENWLPLLRERSSVDRQFAARIKKQAKTFASLLENIKPQAQAENKLERPTGLLIALAYPDRIAKQREASSNTYLLSSGRAAKLPAASSLCSSPWLACAAIGGVDTNREDKIFQATQLSERDLRRCLPHLFSQSESVAWSPGEEQVKAKKIERLGAIVVKEVQLASPQTEAVKDIVLEQLSSSNLRLLNWTNEAQQLRCRAELARSVDTSFPPCEIESLIDNMEQWLEPYLDGIASTNALKKINLTEVLTNYIGWQNLAALDRLTPSHIEAPSGFNIPIDYSVSPPVMKVKLQEMFGAKDSPSILNGKLKCTLHLLSPAGRPLQITQDLVHFWQTSYTEVKKEMKGRYPKHPWPDDPLSAQATRFTKKRRS